MYFGQSFWSEDGEGTPGKKKEIGNKFYWDGKTWMLPAVYLFEQGLAVDFCVQISLDEIKNFISKWKTKEDHLSEDEKWQAEIESPFSSKEEITVKVNGQEAKSSNRCETVWHPFGNEDEAFDANRNKNIEEELLEAYHCSQEWGWKFVRIFFKWPENFQMPLRSLHFRFEKDPIHYPGPCFSTALGEGEKSIEFTHPVSQSKHMLNLLKFEQAELTEETRKLPSSRQHVFNKIPGHYAQITYSVTPPLKEGELQIHDQAKSDPVHMEREEGAASVSIIGGADGPTSIFLFGKSRQPETSLACSSLHDNPVDHVDWKMDFYVNPEQKMEFEAL